MGKQKRTSLDVLMTPSSAEKAESQVSSEGPRQVPAAPPEEAKPRIVRATLYLPGSVHDQLRELAFVERTKMHALLMEGLNRLFSDRGLKPIEELGEE